MIEELLPCPFCKSPAEFDSTHSNVDMPAEAVTWHVGCTNDQCLCYCLTDSFARKTDAAAAWNKRCDAPAALPQTFETREQVIEEIGKAVLRVIDTGGGDYMTCRNMIADISGVPSMAITFTDHCKKIKADLQKHVDLIEKLNAGWFFVPPEPTDEMIHAYMFEKARGQYPHEDAGGGVARKIKALLTGKISEAHRNYQQIIDAAVAKRGKS